MTRLGDLLGKVAVEFDTAGVAYALVGGLAVSVRTEPRFTRDIDLAVVVDGDRSAEALVRRLTPPFVVRALVEHDALDRLATVRLETGDPDDAGPVLDLLFASSGIESEIAEAAEALEVMPGVTVPVARTGHLIALKLLSQSPSRPQDGVDLVALHEVVNEAEHRLVKTAIDQITARGAHRDRDLHADWVRLRKSL